MRFRVLQVCDRKERKRDGGRERERDSERGTGRERDREMGKREREVE